MNVPNTLCDSLFQSDLVKDYDASCKRLLSEKRVLAEIMKSCLEEFREYDIEEIMSQSIQGIPSVGEAGDSIGELNRIQSIGQEDVEESGRITYDVKYYAILPQSQDTIMTGETINGASMSVRSKYLINVEAQNDYYPGYPIVMRGIYYGNRMISAQYGTEFYHSDYGKIKKVYSIWICATPPKYKQNTITQYAIREEQVVGAVTEPREHYDLLTVLIICLGEKLEETGIYARILKLLNVLFRSNLPIREKIEILEQEFNIPMTYEMKEEVKHMCNLGEGIARRALEQGMEQGMELSVKKLVENLNFTIEQALQTLEIPLSKKDYYVELLKVN